jgi:uncharacterized protein
VLTKEQILNSLTKELPQIKKFGVKEIGLFGSYLTNEQTKNSDIDIFVSFEEEKITWENYLQLCFLLDEIFEGVKVEVITKNSLSPHMQPYINPTVQYV